ncbi:PH domain-containing protein [Ferrimonas balearica]|uniref:PH domain-containing protein n=1 Tax=Ferrimonas balearica TaxID=44012 RepID=UPI001C99388D|nr:PH domain-containing protein [Ferrimonas balearica]MBY5991763.1 PH domain-containing protein [Ferrimonas balearica]
MTEDTPILTGRFNPKVCTYWVTTGAIAFGVTIVGLPLLLLWIPLGLWGTRRYLANMECVLTAKALKVKKGIWVKREKTIPLEKITDMGMIQGPLMRAFGLHRLTVETAGQSGEGALVSLIGLEGAPEFREAVLAQRDALSGPAPATAAPASTSEDPATLKAIHETLLRIEAALSASPERPSNSPEATPENDRV